LRILGLPCAVVWGAVVWGAMGSSSASAASGVSDPQPVAFLDAADLFTTLQFDTGYLPGANDPIAIRLYVTPLGGVQTTLRGLSEVSWPPLGHRVSSEPGGSARMDVELAIGAEVKLDLPGVFTGVVPLWTEGVALDAEAVFDGLLLPGHPTQSVELEVDDPALLPDLEYALTVISGVDLVVGVSLTPSASATVRGAAVVSEAGDELLVQDRDALWSDMLPDPDRPGEIGLASRWLGEVDARLDLVIEPEISVDTPLGQFTLARFPVPVTLVETLSPRESPAAYVVHPLPVLASIAPEQAFGTVELGGVANREIPLDNIGELLLEATLRVEGDPAFSVWPTTLAATPDGPTGFVITFAPTTPGAHQGSLVIETNDPTLPLLAVALSGATGSDPQGELGEGDGGSSSLKTCGCGTSGSPAPVLGGWIAALLGPLALRRRRTPAGASRTSGSPRRR
jgi:MYXO-CTERM domain-containing protein